MKDIFKEILQVIPRFIQSFIDLLIEPKSFLQKQIPNDENKLTDALVFIGVSLAITLIIKLPTLPVNTNPVNYLSSDAIWKLTILFLETLIIKISWRLVGISRDYKDFFILNAFCFGVFSVISHLIILLKYSLRTNSSFSLAIFIVCSLALSVWGLLCWNAYKTINNSTVMRSILALIATFLISIPAFLLLLKLRDAFQLGRIPM